MSLPRIVASALVALAFVAVPCWAAPAGYLGVAPQGHADAGAKIATSTCAACHGAHGNSVSPTFPNLAGQNYNYLLKQLENFRSGARKAAPMNSIIGTVPKADGSQNLKNLAAYFSSQSLNRKVHANAQASKLTPTQAKHGYAVFQQGLPAAKVPACAACHAASGTGMAPMAVPALAGQHAPYVEKQLKLFANGKRHNSPDHIMAMIAKRLSASQVKDVALYVEALRPKLMPGIGPKSYQAYAKALAQAPVPGIPASAIQKSNGNANSNGK